MTPGRARAAAHLWPTRPPTPEHTDRTRAKRERAGAARGAPPVHEHLAEALDLHREHSADRGGVVTDRAGCRARRSGHGHGAVHADNGQEQTLSITWALPPTRAAESGRARGRRASVPAVSTSQPHALHPACPSATRAARTQPTTARPRLVRRCVSAGADAQRWRRCGDRGQSCGVAPVAGAAVPSRPRLNNLLGSGRGAVAVGPWACVCCESGVGKAGGFQMVRRRVVGLPRVAVDGGYDPGGDPMPLRRSRCRSRPWCGPAAATARRREGRT